MSSSHTEIVVSRTQGMQGSTPTNARSSKLGTLSVSELRTAMQQHLRSTGALRELKMQLRGMVLAELLQQPKTARMLVHGTSQSVPPSLGEGQRKLDDSKASATGSPGTPAIAIVSGRTDHTLQTWSCGLADALVENHLRRTRRAMSLSIFSTEAEVPPFSVSGAPSEEEQYLAHLFRQIDAGASANPEDDILAPSPSRSMKSVLQRLVEDYVMRQGPASTAEAARHLHSCSTQTEAADSADSAMNPLNSLECRLAAVDAKYALTFAQLKRTGGSGEQPFFLRSEVERRLQQHKNDMHAQLRSEYEQKYNSFTRVKLQEARDEAEGRYRLLAQNKTEELAEMERSLLVKLEQERLRLKMAWEDVHQQRAELERRQRDTIKQLADYDAAKQQSDAELHSWKEKTRALQLQCTKWEELCGTRLMELDGARSREERRVEDIRRLQAEHAAELQLKEEEIGRLRYRLRLVSRESDYSHSAAAAAATASTNRSGKMDTSTVPQAPPRTSTAPVDTQQLYGLLLRTEEMHRNAAVQQQQQQQKRWDAAWVAAAAAAAVSPAPATAAAAAATPERVFAVCSSSPPAPAPQAAVYPSPSSEGQVAQRSPHHSESSDHQVAAASAPAAAIMPASTSAATPAASSPSSPKVSAPAPTATATAVKSPSNSADKPRESSASSKKSLSTRASVAPPSSSVSSTHPTPQKPTSVPAVEAQATESLTSSSTRMSTSSSSALSSASAKPVQPSVHNADDDSKNKSAATALLNAVAEEEQSGRGEVQSEEASARDSIAWLEGNRRELLAEDSKRARSEDGGVVSPWKHFGGGSSGPQFGGGAAAADVGFNESFSSDDAALIHDSDEDDVEF
ncbi:conserved hypothetical protein [Leishmania major strain Friedlin]|uniref:Uncharacterized protein n=1 Tax=Leishmania major TaxID=5664 RepID=Q4Q3E7_LEIMA|nr:conserved hypothetical protein [Leishmania major strain Friedlin]CAG9581826.1 hypothetical_protein_-_conserved [Leishmania major strain Friedlin]CAJ07765.1 conserved hypothetical protein [Leishmania major strain Friedlin]|eukprot:XP_001686151.1 conserved hypothetical protein [Leishmania major strain Friedlin]